VANGWGGGVTDALAPAIRPCAEQLRGSSRCSRSRTESRWRSA
jgi:hypothetical protein